MIKADGKIELDTMIWNSNSVGDEGSVFRSSKKGPSGGNAAIQILRSNKKISDISFQSDQPITGSLWNANMIDGKISSFTNCDPNGCWTINGRVCKSLMEKGSKDKIKEALSTCKDILDPLEERLWTDKDVIKEISAAEQKNILTMKKSFEHSFLAGKSVFFNMQTVNEAGYVLRAANDAITVCDEFFKNALTEEKSPIAPKTVIPSKVTPQ